MKKHNLPYYILLGGYLILIAVVLFGCNAYEPDTDVKMNERGKFEVITFIWHNRDIVAEKYNVDWRNNDVTLSQIDSTINVHSTWADSIITILKSINH